ncbi:hypothetical protein J6590_035244 [Homalodisca vitripennis]|nr:hypothetical protein J6590_035244 [Homalodisca vitripennis]
MRVDKPHHPPPTTPRGRLFYTPTERVGLFMDNFFHTESIQGRTRYGHGTRERRHSRSSSDGGGAGLNRIGGSESRPSGGGTVDPTFSHNIPPSCPSRDVTAPVLRRASLGSQVGAEG